MMRISIGYLYPSVMSQYGDRGNVLTLCERSRRRGIEAEVVPLELGDPVEPDRVDVLLMGGGADTQQRLVAEDLVGVKGEGLRKAVQEGVALLAVCAGYQLLGHFYLAADGTELPGVGIFDAHTVHRAAEIGARMDSITAAGLVRAVGNVVVRGHGAELVGFENHGGRTYLHPGADPLGEVVVGRGNNGDDGTEGCVVVGAIGTYLHGPVLPKNPALADRLLATGLAHRYGGSPRLDSLADAAETAAHDAAVAKALGRGRGSPPQPWHRSGGAQRWPGTERAPHLAGYWPRPARRDGR
jgi:CobQ-like glutamine amidotransferase family enzyme